MLIVSGYAGFVLQAVSLIALIKIGGCLVLVPTYGMLGNAALVSMLFASGTTLLAAKALFVMSGPRLVQDAMIPEECEVSACSARREPFLLKRVLRHGPRRDPLAGILSVIS